MKCLLNLLFGPPKSLSGNALTRQVKRLHNSVRIENMCYSSPSVCSSVDTSIRNMFLINFPSKAYNEYAKLSSSKEYKAILDRASRIYKKSVKDFFI